uniref:Uncharacterized protein n=1 Tax=Amphimedon queenslandica TaxID=400682 RepID=A0A1X7VGR1_AMPQE
MLLMNLRKLCLIKGETYDIKAHIAATLFIVDDSTSINTSTRRHGATRGASGPTRILRGGKDINYITNTHLHNYAVTLDDSTIERGGGASVPVRGERTNGIINTTEGRGEVPNGPINTLLFMTIYFR